MPDEKIARAIEHFESAPDRSEELLISSRGWLPRTLTEQLEVALKILLMVGAVLAANEYFDRREDTRIARSFEFVGRFDSAEYLVPRQTIGRALQQAQQELRRQAALEDEQVTPEMMKERAGRAIEGLVLDGNEGKGLAVEIDQIAGFFSSLEVCVENKLCDGATAHAVFDNYARAFWHNFGPYLVNSRGSSPQAGTGLQAFVGAKP